MGKKLFVILLAASCLFCSACSGKPQSAQAPAEQDYNEARSALAEANRYRTDVTLSEDEQRLDQKLAEWKAAYIASCDGGNPYEMSFLTDENIWNSKLYEFCRLLPKGSDLHLHGLALLPFDELLAFVETRDELFIGTGNDNWCVLSVHEDPAEAPADELPVREALERGVIDREELRAQWTVLGGAEAPDIWVWFETLFDKHLALDGTPAILEAYYVDAFRYYCRNGILHLEFRELFFGSHADALADAMAIRNAYYEVKREYPDLLVSVIGEGLKYTTLDRAITDTLLDNALYIRENIKDDFDPDDVHEFLIGIDLVNEEDRSRPLAEFADQIDEIRKADPDLHLTLHAGETLYATSDNVIDAYLLGAERIGHGLNLYRFPEIMDLVCEDGICLEVCPVSNQALRYVPDLRSHPGVEYLKRGVPICLSSDDPAYMEHGTLTDDFFAAIVCWDLGIAEIKQLCQNSITYACIDDAQKAALMQSWESQWDVFVQQLSK